jgi:hypothetical protein
MADTGLIKKSIEPELAGKFLKKYKCKKISFDNKTRKSIFMSMEPDIVGYNSREKKLYIGEHCCPIK